MKGPTHAPATAAPEGPYEGEAPGRADLSHTRDTIRMIDFLGELRDETRAGLGSAPDMRDVPILFKLLRDHFLGKLTTLYGLAQASGMSYTTAYRSIDALIARGTILRRERTATGKSYSLHPSGALLRRWQDFARDVQRRIEADFLTGADRAERSNAVRRNRRVTPPPGVLPPPAALPHKLPLARSLRLLMHADPTFLAMSGLKRQVEMILGVPVTARALSIDRLRAEIVTNSLRKVSAHDIVACDLPWYGDMIRRNRFIPLNAHLSLGAAELADFMPGAIEGLRRGSDIYGLPVLTTAEMLVYRTDLLAEAGISPPRTMAETLAAARLLHRPAQGVAGIAWNGGRGTALGHTFIVTMAAFGQPVVNLPPAGAGFAVDPAPNYDVRPMFDSAAALASAEALRALLEVSAPDVLAMTWFDRARAYATGSAAMAQCHTMLAHLFERNTASPAYRRTGHLPLPPGPDGVPLATLGGYALSIPENIAPERIGPVIKALRVLTSAETAKLFMVNGSLASPRFSVNADPEVAAISPIISVVDGMARDGTLQVWPRPPVPGISAIITIAGEEIHDMLQGLASPKVALARAQSRAEVALKQRRLP